MKFFGKTFFEEKGFPEPFPKTFSDWEQDMVFANFQSDLHCTLLIYSYKSFLKMGFGEETF